MIRPLRIGLVVLLSSHVVACSKTVGGTAEDNDSSGGSSGDGDLEGDGDSGDGDSGDGDTGDGDSGDGDTGDGDSGDGDSGDGDGGSGDGDTGDGDGDSGDGDTGDGDSGDGDGDSGSGGAGTVGEGAGGTGTGGAGSGGAGAGGTGTGGAGPGKYVGNTTTEGFVDSAGLDYSDYWNALTPEHAGMWGAVQQSATSAKSWATLDALHDYSATHADMRFNQHALLSGSQQPTSASSLIEADVVGWIQGFCARYPDTQVLTVVTEPPPHSTPAYANAIGGGTNTTWQWIINAFLWAEQHCPNSVLIMDDYNNIEYSAENQSFINIVKVLQDAGAPIDAIGAQAHGLSGSVTTTTMTTLLNKLHEETGLPVYITQYDIALADDAAQMQKYTEHFSVFLETDWVPGITVWGWVMGSTWRQNTGLVGANGEPRAAMTWLMNELGRPVPAP